MPESSTIPIGAAAFDLPRDDSASKNDARASQDPLRMKFQQLKGEWKANLPMESSTWKLAMSPAYLKIIGMGPAAVPLLLEELKTEPDLWFVALRSITCADPDPVPHSARGNVAEMAKAWIKWGEERGY